MKKYILIGFVLTLLIASTINAQPNTDYKTSFEINNSEQKTLDFTHTIFAEESTANWCPNCPMAADALYNIYDSGDYPFYYVSLVNDMNPIAKNRNQDYSLGIFKIFAFPTVYFDGGNSNFIGHESTVEETEAEYRALIEQEGQRVPKQPITIESNVNWEGNATITVEVSITNDGNFLYFGKLRSYVTEIVSRWSDYEGNPYHFALLDFAINKVVLLKPGETKELMGTFDGTEIHGNQTYENITSDNIMVISTIFHWRPHFRRGFQGQGYRQKYFAFLADQTTAAIPI